MEPEIFRRCPFCGASIRARASFCPQCGKQVEAKRTSVEVEEQGLQKVDPESSHKKKLKEQIEQAGERPTLLLDERMQKKIATQPVAPKQQERFASGERVHDARPLSNSPIKKVEVVLNESFQDPSLRFLVVVAGLFFLFLIVLFLSKWVS